MSWNWPWWGQTTCGPHRCPLAWSVSGADPLPLSRDSADDEPQVGFTPSLALRRPGHPHVAKALFSIKPVKALQQYLNSLTLTKHLKAIQIGVKVKETKIFKYTSKY